MDSDTKPITFKGYHLNPSLIYLSKKYFVIGISATEILSLAVNMGSRAVKLNFCGPIEEFYQPSGIRGILPTITTEYSFYKRN